MRQYIYNGNYKTELMNYLDDGDIGYSDSDEGISFTLDESEHELQEFIVDVLEYMSAPIYYTEIAELVLDTNFVINYVNEAMMHGFVNFYDMVVYAHYHRVEDDLNENIIEME